MKIEELLKPEEIEKWNSTFKIGEEIIKQYQLAQNNVDAVIAPLQQSIKRWNSVFKNGAEIMLQYQQAVNRMADLFSPYFIKFYENAQYFNDLIKELESWPNKCKKAYYETGWIMSPSITKLPSDVVTESVHAYMAGNKTSIDCFLIGLFSDNNFAKLDEMVEAWTTNKYFVPRFEIIKAAVNDFKKDKHFLSIPALLAQIEGLSYEICVSLTGKGDKNSGRENIEKMKVKMDKKQKIAASSELISDIFIEFIVKYLYKEPRKSKISKKLFVLNRHAILHGHDYNYATKENALRCFLILDYLTVFAHSTDK